jgi:molecular chaperone GrpE
MVVRSNRAGLGLGTVIGAGSLLGTELGLIQEKTMSETTDKPVNPEMKEKINNPNGPQSALMEEIAQLQKQRDDYFDQLQRSRAEFANYQKRSKTQADADRVYAVGTLARDLLDGLDNLQRATDALRASGASGITEGLDMVHRQLLATLSKHGVEPISALGKPFNPNEHEAMIQQPDSEHPEGSVVAELSKGYKIHDRVLRPSKVAVSIAPVTQRSSASGEESD